MENKVIGIIKRFVLDSSTHLFIAGCFDKKLLKTFLNSSGVEFLIFNKVFSVKTSR